MSEFWENMVVLKVVEAKYIPSEVDCAMNYNCCSHHEFIMNDSGAVKDYYFSNGSVIHAGENEMVFLPKGSKYYVKSFHGGG